jgi:glycosyltransferase involved in cell wall biosynthesis
VVTKPSTEAMVRAFVELGFGVDIYCPGDFESVIDSSDYGDEVAVHPFAYGKRWMARHVNPVSWRRYAAICASTEDPVGVAGPLAMLAGRPFIVLADEIKSGTYYGDRGERWKRWCRLHMRRAKLTVVNDWARIGLQREYAGLDETDPVIVYPNAFLRCPEHMDRDGKRHEWGVPEGAFTLAFSGVFYSERGAEWVIKSMPSWADDVHLLLQPGRIDSLTKTLLSELRGSDRIHLRPWERNVLDVWSSISAADAGLVFYLHDGPQFQNMGLSSNRLCMFLQAGLPVIATRQDSFRFIEDYGCGVLIEDHSEIAGAISTIRSDHERMSNAARRAIREKGRLDECYEVLKTQIAKCLA